METFVIMVILVILKILVNFVILVILGNFCDLGYRQVFKFCEFCYFVSFVMLCLKYIHQPVGQFFGMARFHQIKN